MIKRLRFFSLLAFSCGLTACSDHTNNDDLTDYINNLKNNSHAKVHLLDEIHWRQPYYLHSMDLRSPFPQTNDPNQAGTAQAPLERYALDALRLLGIIHQGNTMSAVVLAPDSKVYTVTLGDAIGNQHGLITAITSSSVTVHEMGDSNSAHDSVLRLQNS